MAIIIVIVVIVIIAMIILEVPRYCRLRKIDLVKFDDDYDQVHAKNRFKTSHRTVVSLTTTPDRITLLGPTLASLLDQSIRVDEIAVNIPYKSRKGQEYVIPEWLSNLKHVKLYRVELDEGPATKLLPTLRREKEDTRIIVVDDDVILNSKCLQVLSDSYNVVDCAITNYGIKLSENAQLPNNFKRVAHFMTKSREVDLLQGFSAFLVTPKMFEGQLHLMQELPKDLITVDDIIFSGMLALNKIRIATPGHTFLQLPLVNLGEMRKTPALGSNENKKFVTDNAAIKWFREVKGIW
ncbi:MAG: hypothetical protein ACMG6E_04515 [Candidatus Roizmanbacteria bacterium]